jgi:hypothetical protein
MQQYDYHSVMYACRLESILSKMAAAISLRIKRELDDVMCCDRQERGFGVLYVEMHNMAIPNGMIVSVTYTIWAYQTK